MFVSAKGGEWKNNWRVHLLETRKYKRQELDDDAYNAYNIVVTRVVLDSVELSK